MEFLNAFSHMDWTLVLHLTWQHITLVGIAVTLAIVVGVPLGVLMTRFPTLAGPMQASATVLLTIPSIALFGLMIPLFSIIGQGIGALQGQATCSQGDAAGRRQAQAGGCRLQRTAIGGDGSA